MSEVSALAASGEWEDLLGRTSSPEIFRSWPWISSWWGIFGADGTRRPLVIAIRQGKTLVGLAPFLLRERRGPAGLPIRRLEFLGTGEDECDEICSDYLDIYAATGWEDQVARAVWQVLLDEQPRWDEAVFRNVLDGSILSRLVQPMARDSGRGARRWTSGERFWVDLSGGDFNAYVEGLSKKKKKRIFYYRRRLEKEGGFVEKRVEKREEIGFFLEEIARLSTLRRGQQGKASAWQSEKFRAFHADVAPRLWDLGWLDLRLWMKEGRAVAALYNFLYDGTIYYYQSGFDTDAFGNVSPGLVTISHVIEWGFSNQQRRYDFMVGNEGSYKEDYACLTETAVDLVFHNQTVRGLVLHSAASVRGVLADWRAQAAARAQPPSSEESGPRATPEPEVDPAAS